jgi:hypothetical protein
MFSRLWFPLFCMSGFLLCASGWVLDDLMSNGGMYIALGGKSWAPCYGGEI